MYIKAIHITGFRSYRERTAIEGLSRHFNVVVGQNGSGKSNFFAAIQFVLSEEFGSLSAEERQNLLHEGTGNRSSVATVEILFDNSDRRLQAIEANEFTISRQISAKKDQYFIDNRLTTRSEILSLMESAGFSRSNPYYIVKQGKIAELATATDLARLKLLREVAGTRVYDEKKKASLELLEQTDIKINKSKELLKIMDKSLATLEEEKEELKEYQKQDKIRRALEYSLNNSEVRDAKKEFDACSTKRQELQLQLNEAESNKFETSRKVNAIELEIRTLETREKCLVEEIAAARARESQLIEEKTACSLKTSDLKDHVERIQSGKNVSEQQLENLQQVIAEKEQELEELKPKYAELLEKESELKGDLNIASRKLNSLYAKTDNQFTTVEDRDQHLKRKIMNLEHHINDNRDHSTKMKTSFEEERQTMIETEQRISEIEILLRDHINEIDKMTIQDEENRELLDKMTRILHQKISERKKISDQLTEKEAQCEHLKASFYQSLRKSTADGIRSIDFIIADLKANNNDGKYDKYINGYHGVVIKLMKAEPTYFKAIETTAGSTLSYHVVDTDEIALFLLNEMNSRRYRGEVNFFPLNRVYAPDLRPLRDTAKGRHLLSLIQYSEKYAVVFRQIFGGTILVSKIADGRTIAKNEQFDCITLEGDQISHSGPMTGGYVDSRKSRLDITMNISALEKKIYALKNEYDKLTQEYVEAERDVEKVKNDLSKNDQQRESIQRIHDQVSLEKRSLIDLRNRINLNIEKGNVDLLALDRKYREMISHMDEMKAQIGTPLSDSSIKEEINKANEDVKECRNKLDELSKELNVVAIKKAKLDSELNACLYRRREDVLQKTGAIDLEVKRHELQNAMMEMKKIQDALKDCYNNNEELQDELKEVRSKILGFRIELDEYIEKRNEAEEVISQNTSDIEGLRRKMTDLVNKKEEALNKMKELGTLPVNLINEFSTHSKTKLEKLWMVNVQKMKKYNNVNKKALDQFVRSAAERDELKSQIEELEKSHEHINKLLEITETKKHDTLYLTFKQVAKNFHDIFKKLVAVGVGDLVMKTAPVDPNDPTAVEKSKSMHVMERFIGVGIRVNFNNDSPEGCREAFSLSGGQKTLVALALIFAIQKCDPAPFYLFDEIDAALDREKRTAVASLIGDFSLNAQFISTTFRPEMLNRADRCYGVRFRNKISYISVIDAADAYEFLSKDDDEQDRESPDRDEPMQIS